MNHRDGSSAMRAGSRLAETLQHSATRPSPWWSDSGGIGRSKIRFRDAVNGRVLVAGGGRPLRLGQRQAQMRPPDWRSTSLVHDPDHRARRWPGYTWVAPHGPSIPSAGASPRSSPAPTRVLLWTRLPPGRAEARWEVAADPDLRQVVAGGDAAPAPERDHTVCVDADRPGAGHHLLVPVRGRRRPGRRSGRTRTLPVAPVDRFRIGYVCCSRYSVAPLGVYRAMAEREVDLVVHLGDYIYEDDEQAAAPGATVLRGRR